MPTAGASGTSQGEFEQMWRRQWVWWHVWFAAGLLATLVAVAATAPGPRGRLPEFALLGVVGIMYAVVGAPGVAKQRTPWITAYLVVAWAAVLGCVALNPDASSPIMFFVLFPQLWAGVSRARQGVVATFVVVALYAGIGWHQAAAAPEGRGQVLINAAFSLVLSLALGLFILRLISEAESRAATIDALREAQDQLAAAERDRGVSAERERLSREIHDTLAQGFTSVLALSRAAEAALARGDLTKARDHLALVHRTAADNLQEARLIVAETTPGHLESRTLVQALERLVSEVHRSSALDTHLEVVGDPEALGATLEVVLLRTAQEAVANIRRHAGASTVAMRIVYAEPGAVTLSVTDDGCGFDSQHVCEGFGLDGIRARSAQVGGRADITSEPGCGTTVRVTVPR